MRLDTAEKRAAYRASMIPKGAERDMRSSNLGEAYTYASATGVLYGLGFRGSAGRTSFHYRFRDAERREAYLVEFFKSVASWAETMAERKAKRVASPRILAPGDVLRASWGYDQTNIDYYEVTRLIGKKQVEIREIGCQSEETGFMSGNCVPTPGKYIGDPMIKLDQNGSVKIASYASAHKINPITEIEGKKIFPTSNWTAYA